MTDIQKLIEERPHLKDPFEFYARWQRFQGDADKILAKNRDTRAPAKSTGYPRDSVGPLLQAFAAVFELPREGLAPLRKPMEGGNINFSKLPLDELPSIALPPGVGELGTTLFLLCRPWFLRLRKACLLDGRQWEDGRCPLCSARPALASIAEGPSRQLHCSWCGTTGPAPRFIGCPNCGNEDAEPLGTLVPEGEPGFRVATCDTCKTYVKIVEGPLLTAMSPDLADLASLPLDIVAQGNDYLRRAPNPIGLTRVS